MLTIVPTPIGNLKDITLRAIEILKQVNGIICEDTRRTSILLNHYEIKKPLLVLNDFNETKTFPQILQKLQANQHLALVSDAGTPLISDPGYKLVRACLEMNIKVDSLPGPVSPITALTLSGLPPDKFMFIGYLPEKTKALTDLLNKLKNFDQELPTTYIGFISPYKLIRTLTDIQAAYGDVEVCLAQELTKIYQSVKSQTLSQWLKDLENKGPKGEYIILWNLN